MCIVVGPLLVYTVKPATKDTQKGHLYNQDSWGVVPMRYNCVYMNL